MVKNTNATTINKCNGINKRQKIKFLQSMPVKILLPWKHQVMETMRCQTKLWPENFGV